MKSAICDFKAEFAKYVLRAKWKPPEAGVPNNKASESFTNIISSGFPIESKSHIELLSA
jgi:hypothetical protein